jgi:ribosomal protein L32
MNCPTCGCGTYAEHAGDCNDPSAVAQRQAKQDRLDKIALADAYIPLQRCKNCGRLTHQNYLCLFCGRE